MRHLLFVLTIVLAVLACGGSPTPSQAETYTEIYEAEREAGKYDREAYYECIANIKNEVDILEENADACSDDNCRAKIAEKLEEIANNLYVTCSPVPGDLLSNLRCQEKLIQAKASYMYGAPNEIEESQMMAEEILANQVQEAYESCFSLFPELSP